ncbi:MAG: hypothetical protein ACPG5B_00220 [Chitinophagales bacterium]
MLEKIKQHLEKFTFDIKVSRDSRFTDQKVIPDVLSAVSECVLEYIQENKNMPFSKTDIWKSNFANDTIMDVFSKPNLKNADNEYNKFFAQPLKALAAAKILHETKRKKTNIYTVNEYEILSYIAKRERHALNFLNLYLTKVLEDSNIYQEFELFFKCQDKTTFKNLRKTLFTFYHTNTNIKGKYEPPRIFNKIINILAYKRKSKGSIKGQLSKNIISIEEIRYNKVNWRDFNKDKNLTREEYKTKFEEKINTNNANQYYLYNIKKAKSFVKNLHPYSEIHRFEAYPATQAHHIFMQSEFPNIADLPENIIALTPNQHYYYAHPNNNTKYVDEYYLIICLLAKLDSIEINFRENKEDYSLKDFIKVLNIGFSTNHFKTTMNYEKLKHEIVKLTYSK